MIVDDEEDENEDQKSVSDSEEDEEANKGYFSRWFGKIKNVFSMEYLVDFVVGGYFDKDEEEIEINYHYENDALDNGLSYTKMTKVVEKRLPRKNNNEPFSVCGTKTGWHCCWKKYRKTDVAEMGIGMSLYFKMIKFFIFLFALFTIISIPSYIFFTDGDGLCSISQSTPGIILSSITVGNLGSKLD